MAQLTQLHLNALQAYEEAIGDPQYDQDEVAETLEDLRSFALMTQREYDDMLLNAAAFLDRMSS